MNHLKPHQEPKHQSSIVNHGSICPVRPTYLFVIHLVASFKASCILINWCARSPVLEKHRGLCEYKSEYRAPVSWTSLADNDECDILFFGLSS